MILITKTKSKYVKRKSPYDAELQCQATNFFKKQYFEPTDAFGNTNVGEPAHSHINIASQQIMFQNSKINGSTSSEIQYDNKQEDIRPHGFDKFPVVKWVVPFATYISQSSFAKTPNPDHIDVVYQHSILPAKSPTQVECSLQCDTKWIFAILK
ncbi:hypothetical protein Tco_0024586, partial [Tanacetum coccineum]